MQEFRRTAMLRPVITATALVALAGSSFAFAQHGFGSGAGDDQPRFEQRHHLSAADVSAFADARIAALKAGLQLTPDQAKNWPPFEQAVRDLVQLRVERLQARQAGEQQQQGTPFERLSRRADSMAKSSAALKKIADAGAPLYQSLNDDQKGRFMRLARMLRPHQRMHGDHDRGWRDDRRDG
jgi:LTXXQ motif family protein